MSDKLFRLDDAWLSLSDRLVLFIWNQTEISRANMCRMLTLTLLVQSAATRDWNALAVWLVCLTIDEVLGGGSARSRNARVSCLRTLWHIRICRMAAVSLMIFVALFFAYWRDAATVFFIVTALLYNMVTWALTPEDPPQRRLPRLALAPVGA